MIKNKSIIVALCFLFYLNAVLIAQVQVVNNIQHIEQIQETISLIEQDSIYSYVSELQNFETRFELHDNRFDVSQWIYDKFQSFGYEDVLLDTFLTPIYYNSIRGIIDSTFLQRNVICTIPGDTKPNELCIVVAHYDSYTSESNLQFSNAPGADDNGSGVSSLLEIARILKETNFIPKRTILLIATAAEELGNFGTSGAEYVADRLVLENSDVSIVINVDMIGYSKRLLQHSLYIGSEEASSPVAQYTKYVFDDYTNIEGVPVDYWGGDLKTFVDAGFYGIYFEEYVFNPAWHSANDILYNMHFEYCTQVIQGVAATLFQFCDIPALVQNDKAIKTSDSNQIHLSWNASKDINLEYYNIYISLDGGVTYNKISLSDTTYTFQNNISNSDVRYAITAKTTDNFESIGIIKELHLDHLSINDSSIINDFELKQNYPNPFNPATQINYVLPIEDNILITISDINGHIVKELVNEFQMPGNYSIEWNGKDNSGESVSSGIYLVGLKTTYGVFTKKVTLIR